MDDLVISRSLTVKDSELKERFSRSGGPGGQGVNTADSRVELSYDVANASGIGPTIRARLLERLATAGWSTACSPSRRASTAPSWPTAGPPASGWSTVLREAAAPPPRKRRPTKPTRGSKERRLAEKKRRGVTKQGRQGRWD